MQSIRLLSDAAKSFTDNCVVGIKANEARIDELLRRREMTRMGQSRKSESGADTILAL